MKTAADNSQPINKISYRQQLSTLQDEGQQETKNEKRNEAIAIPPSETDESIHYFRTESKIKMKSSNETCIGITKLRRKQRLFQGGRQRLAGALLGTLPPLGPNFFKV